MLDILNIGAATLRSKLNAELFVTREVVGEISPRSGTTRTTYTETLWLSLCAFPGTSHHQYPVLLLSPAFSRFSYMHPTGSTVSPVYAHLSGIASVSCITLRHFPFLCDGIRTHSPARAALRRRSFLLLPRDWITLLILPPSDTPGRARKWLHYNQPKPFSVPISAFSDTSLLILCFFPIAFRHARSTRFSSRYTWHVMEQTYHYFISLFCNENLIVW